MFLVEGSFTELLKLGNIKNKRNIHLMITSVRLWSVFFWCIRPLCLKPVQDRSIADCKGIVPEPLSVEATSPSFRGNFSVIPVLHEHTSSGAGTQLRINNLINENNGLIIIEAWVTWRHSKCDAASAYTHITWAKTIYHLPVAHIHCSAIRLSHDSPSASELRASC